MAFDDGRHPSLEAMTDAELDAAVEQADRDRLRRLGADQLERWQTEIAELLAEKSRS